MRKIEPDQKVEKSSSQVDPFKSSIAVSQLDEVASSFRVGSLYLPSAVSVDDEFTIRTICMSSQ